MREVTLSRAGSLRFAVLVCTALGLLTACGDTKGDSDPGASVPPPAATSVPASSAGGEPGHGVDVSALTANTVCDALPAETVAAITGHDVSSGKGVVGACEWSAPQAIRVRLFPPGEWSPDSGGGGYRELSGIGSAAYVAKGAFGNGYQAEALLADRAVAAIIPAEWASEDMAITLLRAAVERLG